MTITWRRLGYLGFMIPLAFLAIATMVGGVTNFKAIRIAMILAAIAVWFLGVKLNGEELEDDGKPPHLAFGYPMQYSALIGVGGFVLTFA